MYAKGICPITKLAFFTDAVFYGCWLSQKLRLVCAIQSVVSSDYTNNYKIKQKIPYLVGTKHDTKDNKYSYCWCACHRFPFLNANYITLHKSLAVQNSKAVGSVKVMALPLANYIILHKSLGVQNSKAVGSGKTMYGLHHWKFKYSSPKKRL